MTSNRFGGSPVGPLHLAHWRAKGYSQYGADGVIHKLFSDLGTTDKYYVEFGTQSGRECNTRRLRETCGWSGLLMDGGYNNGAIGQHQHFLTRENIVPLLAQYNVPHAFDLLSVDVDGNDFHLLAAILHASYRPRVVIVETCFGLNASADAVIRHDPNHVWQFPSCYGSASVLAYLELAKYFGYSMVLGMPPDLYWVRDDVFEGSGYRYDTTNDAEAMVRAARQVSASCEKAWRLQGTWSSMYALSQLEAKPQQ